MCIWIIFFVYKILLYKYTIETRKNNYNNGAYNKRCFVKKRYLMQAGNFYCACSVVILAVSNAHVGSIIVAAVGCRICTEMCLSCKNNFRCSIRWIHFCNVNYPIFMCRLIHKFKLSLSLAMIGIFIYV